ncbi:P-loop containing nucleoside triphosphate hydrolase protein [Phascolomyces articulosus]|uniref:P-loop containing nucleoside triphosphate hydrolase protein n=1 Tax=Phascolomyces articulosus TaxID=60185 RepID=A0AAD5JS85_9FUNG|nr:P-loop containing nucleoside triphosphate hydrolase protein [Phascolomyces articulosus]
MPLQVICAGYSRTGTLSLQQALAILGYRTHHGMSVLTDQDQNASIWLNAYKNPGSVEWEDAYGNYDAASDWPTCVFYKELMERYPESKVILSIRTAESWYKSIQKTILPLVQLRHMGNVMPERVRQVRETWFGTFVRGHKLDLNDVSILFDRKRMMQMYNEHIEEVKRTVPADRLLIMSLGDGWEPLCSFLGKPIPKQSYPVSNTGGDFSSIFWTAMKRGSRLGRKKKNKTGTTSKRSNKLKTNTTPTTNDEGTAAMA